MIVIQQVTHTHTQKVRESGNPFTMLFPYQARLSWGVVILGGKEYAEFDMSAQQCFGIHRFAKCIIPCVGIVCVCGCVAYCSMLLGYDISLLAISYPYHRPLALSLQWMVTDRVCRHLRPHLFNIPRSIFIYASIFDTGWWWLISDYRAQQHGLLITVEYWTW